MYSTIHISYKVPKIVILMDILLLLLAQKMCESKTLQETPTKLKKKLNVVYESISQSDFSNKFLKHSQFFLLRWGQPLSPQKRVVHPQGLTARRKEVRTLVKRRDLGSGPPSGPVGDSREGLEKSEESLFIHLLLWWGIKACRELEAPAQELMDS